MNSKVTMVLFRFYNGMNENKMNPEQLGCSFTFYDKFVN